MRMSPRGRCLTVCWSVDHQKNMTDKEGNWTIGTGYTRSQDFAELKLWNGKE